LAIVGRKTSKIEQPSPRPTANRRRCSASSQGSFSLEWMRGDEGEIVREG
jgi:hypothetical protein